MTKPSVSLDTARSGGHLEPDAINVTEDTIIGMAASAPAASVGLTLAPLGGANAYRKLNMWNASAGASFEWVGRAINPYLGFLTGWLMVAAYVLGTLSGVEVLAPSVLSVFGSNSTATWGNIGIKLTARTQIAMALVEYAI